MSVDACVLANRIDVVVSAYRIHICREISYNISSLTRVVRTLQLDNGLIRSQITVKTSYQTRESDQTHTQPYNLLRFLISPAALNQELNPVSNN